MKNFYLFFFLFLLQLNSFSQQFEWVTDISCSNRNISTAGITTDQSNHVFIAGQLFNNTDFMPGAGTQLVNIPVSNAVAYVAKYTASGSLLWAKPFGIGALFIQPFAMNSDVNGNIYISGIYGDTADFDPGIDTFNLIEEHQQSSFILKLDNNGNFIWAKSLNAINSIGESICYDVRPDNLGNIYILGTYSDTCDFDPGPGTFLMSGANSTNSFFAKYDENGNFIWAKNIDGFTVYNIVFDQSGNCVFAGAFMDTIDIDPGPGVFELPTASVGSYITKFDTAGNFIWATYMTGYAVHYRIALDDADTIYNSGYIWGACDFNPMGGGFPMTNVNGRDGYFAKFSPNGQFIAVNTIIGGGDQQFHDITFDAGNDIIVSGKFEGTPDFDPGAGTNAIASNGDMDVFVASYHSDGSLEWIKTFGGTLEDNVRRSYLNTNGELYLIGTFLGTVDFDPLNAGGDLIASSTHYSSYLIKYSYAVTVDELEKSSALLYPNPSSDFVQLKLDNNTEQKFSVEIYNLAGRLVKTVTGFGQELSIPVNDFSNGAYYIKINSDAGTEVMQFIVIK